jgi:spore germination protein KC
MCILSGCWDKKELEQMSYTTVIGLDLPQGVDLNKEQAVDVTFQFSNPKLNVKGAPTGEEKPTSNTITLTAPDFVTAKNMANSSITRQISFSHSKAIIVSESLARKPVFFQFLGSALKEREMRRETNIIVVKGKASDFIKNNNPELMVSHHKYYQFIIERSVETGLVPESTINRLMSITDGDGDLFLAIYGDVNKQSKKNAFHEEDHYTAGEVPKEGGNPIQLMGSAVIKEGTMIGTLTGEETRGALLLDNTSKVEDMFVSYPDPLKKKYKVALRLKKKTNTKVKILLRSGSIKINVKVPVEAELLSIPSFVNYADDLKNQAILKKSVEENIKKNLIALVKRTQKEFKSEPFYWSLYARPLFLTVEQYEKWDWTRKRYPFADVSITVDVEITGFGKQMKESEINKVRD